MFCPSNLLEKEKQFLSFQMFLICGGQYDVLQMCCVCLCHLEETIQLESFILNPNASETMKEIFPELQEDHDLYGAAFESQTIRGSEFIIVS